MVGTSPSEIGFYTALAAAAASVALLVVAGTAWLRGNLAGRSRALAVSESRYERIFAESPAANFVSTPSGQLLACNAFYAKILGFESIEHALAASTRSIYPDPRDREAMLDRLRRERRLVAQEHKLLRVDGSIVEVQENVVGQFNDAGELTQLHGFMLDLTERRRLENEFRQAQKMEAIGRLAGGVAHDFNNLLTVILASSDMALESLEEGHEARADIEDVRGAARRAVALTAQLLSFSRRQVLQESVVDASAIVDGMSSMIRRLVSAEVAIELELPPPTRSLQPIFVDPHQLEQALLNLCVNASDAMPAGGVLHLATDEVTLDDSWVAANAGSRAGRYCRIQVRDSGSGMDATTIVRAFEPFFTTKAVGKGTGLGLSMVFGFIKQSGGYVTIESVVNEGTTVSLYLPVTMAVDEPQLASGRTHAVPSRVGRRGSGTVLIVEDNAEVRALAARVIGALGFETLVAASAREATELALTVDSLALVLTDVVMPNGGGEVVAAAMRARFPGVPVTYMSGYTENENVLSNVRVGRHAFIAKPFSADSLAAAVLGSARSVAAVSDTAEHVVTERAASPGWP